MHQVIEWLEACTVLHNTLVDEKKYQDDWLHVHADNEGEDLDENDVLMQAIPAGGGHSWRRE